MATTHGREDPSVIELLRRSPQEFDFFQAVLVLELFAQTRARPGKAAPLLGETTDLAEEPVAFVGAPELGGPPADAVAFADREGARPELAVAVLGLVGFVGVLPQHYSELVLMRLRDNDEAARAFLDALTHRTVSLFVRAWKKYRLAAQVLVAGGDAAATKAGTGITGFIDAVLGFGTKGHRDRLSVPHDVLRFYAGALAGNPASPAMLEAMLSDYFGESIRVDTFVARWETLAPSEQTKLVPTGYCRLGEEALLGARILRPDGAFRIRIGPLSYARFRAFLPDGRWLRELIHLVRLFVGEALHFDTQPTLEKGEVPELQLRGVADDRSPRLGWNTWVISAPPATDRSDAILGSDLVA